MQSSTCKELIVRVEEIDANMEMFVKKRFLNTEYILSENIK